METNFAPQLEVSKNNNQPYSAGVQLQDDMIFSQNFLPVIHEIQERVFETPIGLIEERNLNEHALVDNIRGFLRERADLSISEPWMRVIGSDGRSRVPGFDQPESEMYDMRVKVPHYEFMSRADAEVASVLAFEKLAKERSGQLSMVFISPPSPGVEIETIDGSTSNIMVFVVSRSLIDPNIFSSFVIRVSSKEGQSVKELQHKSTVLAALLDPQFVKENVNPSPEDLIAHPFVLQDIDNNQLRAQFLSPDGRLNKDNAVEIISTILGKPVRTYRQEQQDFEKVMQILASERVIARFTGSLIFKSDQQTMQGDFNLMINRFNYLMALYKNGEKIEQIIEIAKLSSHVLDFSTPFTGSSDERNNSSTSYDMNNPYEQARSQSNINEVFSRTDISEPQSDQSPIETANRFFFVPQPVFGIVLTDYTQLPNYQPGDVKSNKLIPVHKTQRVKTKPLSQFLSKPNLNAKRCVSTEIPNIEGLPIIPTPVSHLPFKRRIMESSTFKQPDKFETPEIFIPLAPTHRPKPPVQVIRINNLVSSRTVRTSRVSTSTTKSHSSDSKNEATKSRAAESYRIAGEQYSAKSSGNEQTSKTASSKAKVRTSARTTGRSSQRISVKINDETKIPARSTSSSSARIYNTASLPAPRVVFHQPQSGMRTHSSQSKNSAVAIVDENLSILSNLFSTHQVSLLQRFDVKINSSVPISSDQRSLQSSTKLTKGQVKELIRIGIKVEECLDGFIISPVIFVTKQTHNA